MEQLKAKMRAEGSVIDTHVLKVDTFLNHQVDPIFMLSMAEEWKRRLGDEKITKIVTLESSGIAPALILAQLYGVEMIFARKKKSITMDDSIYTADVYSYTKKLSHTITISKSFLTEQDHVLIIDDFLANGEAALGLCDVIEQSGATIAAIGIVIEKSFQPGRQKLLEKNYRVESLARIASLNNGEITFIEEKT
ncbi:xanthine phosphoribosyltransferase [Geomicrobium halophilum]|nr:xanthine phosphoribosyltransferase [Geomicrobium halophilum]